MTILDVKNVWESHLPKLESAFVGYPWHQKIKYALYLSQTYRYITHSCLLLEYAAKNTNNYQLKDCLQHHHDEEFGHEKLALNDLKKLGFSLNDFPELPITQEIYKSIYHQIDLYGPSAIVGYALALEGVSSRRCPEISQKLIEIYGKDKCTLIKLHGDVDPGHIEDSFNVLNFFNEKELEHIANIIVQSIDRYILYLNELELNEQSSSSEVII